MLLPVELDRTKGFTLIEVMIAVVVMMVGLLALLQTVNLSMAYNNANKLRNDAILFADEAVGKERTKAFSAVVNSSTNVSHKFNLGFINYSIVNTVSGLSAHSFDTDRIAGAKNLLVRVTWRDKGVRKNHSITTTIIESAN